MTLDFHSYDQRAQLNSSNVSSNWRQYGKTRIWSSSRGRTNVRNSWKFCAISQLIFFFCFLFKWKLIWTRRSRTGWKQLDRSTSGRLRSITACSSICLASTHSSHLAFGWRSMWVELFGLSVRWSNFFYDLSLHNRTARSTQFITATESNRSRLNKRRRWSSTQSFRWLTMSRPAATRCGRWFWRTPTDIWRPRIRNTSTGWCKKMKLKISL